MNVEVGTEVWIPCEVKPGPFSDERLVRLQSSFGTWVGFVELPHLKDRVENGPTAVRSVVVRTLNGDVVTRPPGHPLGAREFREYLAQVRRVDAVET